jgi:NAD(P)-dependent dehydrogenase (short-subunit alcohol dehydrogenase family)
MRPIAVVTGASRGIGAAVVRRLTDGGHDCVAIGLNQPETCALFIRADLSDAVAAETAGRELGGYLRARCAAPAVLVNNAGGAPPATAVDITPDQVHRDITLNLVTPILLTRVVLDRMRDSGNGVVVNVSSTAGRTGVAYLPAYSAAKAGLIAYTQSLAAEAAAYGVRVNCVCPGAVDTEGADNGREGLALLHGLERDAYQEAMAGRTGLGRLLQPAEVADVVHWLVADAGPAVNGQTINVCGTLMMG